MQTGAFVARIVIPGAKNIWVTTMAKPHRHTRFATKEFKLGEVSGMLVALQDSGIIKISCTETEVQITVWDCNSENIIHAFTCKHEDLFDIEEENA